MILYRVYFGLLEVFEVVLGVSLMTLLVVFALLVASTRSGFIFFETKLCFLKACLTGICLGSL